MTKIHSFAPISHSKARVLILGSIPGTASIEANQYYAHTRNAFWPIMDDLFKIAASLPYEARIQALQKTNVAIWDVLYTCNRVGSLDSAIQANTRIPNDFASFFTHHPHIRLIAFNGIKAEKSFQQHVLKTLTLPDLSLIRLPSTSPAHTMPLAQKIAAWRSIITTL